MIPEHIRDTIRMALNTRRSYLYRLVKSVEPLWINVEWYAPAVARAQGQIAHIEAIDAALTWLETLPNAPQPDWSQAPAWAMYWAVDPNGWAHWFQEEPVLALTINYSGWIAKTVHGVQIGAELWAAEYDLPLGVDWRTLKAQRP